MPHPRTLRGQTLLAVVGIHALIIPLFFGGLVFFVNKAFTEQFVNQIRTETRLFATLIPEDLDPARLREIFYTAAAGSPLLSVELVSDSGELLWSFASPVAPVPASGFREDFFFGQHGDEVYHISTPLLIEAPSAPGAQLRLGFDERPTVEQVSIVYQRGAALTLGYLVLTLLLAGYWIHRLNRPIRALGEASRRVASGEFREPIHVATTLPEILALAGDINHMHRELLKNTDAMEHMAMHDLLTGLPNRALLTDRVAQAIAQAERDRASFALMLMDLDHFKEINDTLGHAAGDEVLRMVPGRLAPLLREVDTMARLGGDEFAFLLPGTDATGAIRVVRRIAEVMQEPFCFQGQNLHLGQSIGIAVYPDHRAGRFDDLLRQADIAMYAAKQARREYFVFSPSIDPHSRDRLELANQLRADIDAGRLQVHYQPQVRLGDGAVCAIEALVRWQAPGRGNVAPDEFIPIADRLGLMDALTRAVVRQSFRDYACSPPLHGMALCINVTASNLRDPTLPDFLADALHEFEVEPANVVLEITEHECIADAGNALQQLAVLRGMGFGLAIDDFGKGHSSFQYLKHLPATEVKIDRSFVADMSRDRHDYSLVAAIVALGRQLGLSVVAEGVQDDAALHLLEDLGCDRVQGFHIAAPMPAPALLEMVRTYRNSGHEHGRALPTP